MLKSFMNPSPFAVKIPLKLSGTGDASYKKYHVLGKKEQKRKGDVELPSFYCLKSSVLWLFARFSAFFS